MASERATLAFAEQQLPKRVLERVPDLHGVPAMLINTPRKLTFRVHHVEPHAPLTLQLSLRPPSTPVLRIPAIPFSRPLAPPTHAYVSRYVAQHARKADGAGRALKIKQERSRKMELLLK